MHIYTIELGILYVWWIIILDVECAHMGDAYKWNFLHNNKFAIVSLGLLARQALWFLSKNAWTVMKVMSWAIYAIASLVM